MSTILLFLIFLYVLAFIYYICKTIYIHSTLNHFSRISRDLFNILDGEKINIRSDRDGRLALQNSFVFENDLKAIDFKNKFEKEYQNISPYIYNPLWINGLESKIVFTIEFSEKLEYYKHDYSLSYIIEHTLKVPSMILSCFFSISENKFTKLVSLASGILTLYGVFEKFVLPILQSKGLL